MKEEEVLDGLDGGLLKEQREVEVATVLPPSTWKEFGIQNNPNCSTVNGFQEARHSCRLVSVFVTYETCSF
jgi:hypothetical protein